MPTVPPLPSASALALLALAFAGCSASPAVAAGAATPAVQAAADAPEPADAADDPALRFTMVDPEKLPHPKDDRRNYGVRIGGGMGVVVAPHWVLTAAHCITWDAQKNGKVSARIVGKHAENPCSRRADLVIRHPDKDLALVRLTEPFPEGAIDIPLLLKDPVKGRTLQVKKALTNTLVYRGIPARGKTDNWIVAKDDREGKAGTSGSPWLVHSTQVGDVLVGITHGTGRSPQIGWVRNWLQGTVAKNSQDTLYWATLEQAAQGQPAAGARDGAAKP